MEFRHVVSSSRNPRINIQVNCVNAAQNPYNYFHFSFLLSRRQSKAIAITCMAFPKNEINNFILGSEDGNVYSGKNFPPKINSQFQPK